MSGLSLYYALLAFVAAAAVGFAMAFLVGDALHLARARWRGTISATAKRAATMIAVAPAVALGAVASAVIWLVSIWAAALSATIDRYHGGEQ